MINTVKAIYSIVGFIAISGWIALGIMFVDWRQTWENIRGKK